MKKILLILALAALISTAAFADLSFGLNGALYMDDAELEDATGESLADQFRSGEAINYGLMAEIMGEKISLGGSFMGTTYLSEFTGYKMVDMDLNLVLDAHLIHTRSVIDPFVGAGLGYIFKDYANEEDDDDEDNPLTATAYWFLNAGLGLNFGPVGVFAKFLYHIPMRAVYGNDALSETQLEPYGLKPYKIVVGGKVMLPFVPRR